MTRGVLIQPDGTWTIHSVGHGSGVEPKDVLQTTVARYSKYTNVCGDELEFWYDDSGRWRNDPNHAVQEATNLAWYGPCLVVGGDILSGWDDRDTTKTVESVVTPRLRLCIRTEAQQYAQQRQQLLDMLEAKSISCSCLDMAGNEIH
jgi:hypothetical protein